VGLVQNIELMILGESGESLPAGETGEILVRGPGVIRGYENDADADRLGFHDGWWRTGDLGFADADRYLFITGRLKEIINRGGLKVSPGEVDELFMRHPTVREAATFGVAHPSLGEDVVTAVILREAGSITAEQLRDYALPLIAPFKVPSSVLIVEDLPRNALGKVQRRALAESLAGSLRADFVAPRSAEETFIAQIFASVLGLPRVGARDHFFHLGGDSLRAMQVLSRVSTLTGVEMQPLAVFEAPTVEALARRIATARPGAIPPVQRRRGAENGKEGPGSIIPATPGRL